MTNDKIIGVVLGAIVCAAVIAGNVRRADRHGGSVYPGLPRGLSGRLVRVSLSSQCLC